MFLYYWLIAYSLLATPACQEIPDIYEWNTVEMRDIIREICIKNEVIEEKEGYLTAGEDFKRDLEFLRIKWDDLRDAPPIIDVIRFPDKEIIHEFLVFNRRFRNEMVEQQDIGGNRLYNDFQVIITETDILYSVYDNITGFKSSYDIAYRRVCLKKLRDTIGYDAYYQGILPPCVPAWRFREID